MADSGSVASNGLWVTPCGPAVSLFFMVYVTFLDDICHYHKSKYVCRMLAVVDWYKMTTQIKRYFDFML